MVAAVIGLRQPHDRQRRRPLSTISAAEPLGHRAVAVETLGQGRARRIIDRLASRSIAAGGVIDKAVPVRVLEIGRAGRNIGARDRDFAVPAQPLGEGRHVQRAAGRAAHPVREIGMPGRAAHQPVALVERHRVAEEAVPRRQAAGRDRGGAGPRRRGKDAAMRGEPGAALAEFEQKRRVVGSDQIGAQTVADDDDGAFGSVHRAASVPYPSAVGVIQYQCHSGRSRRYRNCAAGAIAPLPPPFPSP